MWAFWLLSPPWSRAFPSTIGPTFIVAWPQKSHSVGDGTLFSSPPVCPFIRFALPRSRSHPNIIYRERPPSPRPRPDDPRPARIPIPRQTDVSGDDAAPLEEPTERIEPLEKDGVQAHSGSRLHDA